MNDWAETGPTIKPAESDTEARFREIAGVYDHHGKSYRTQWVNAAVEATKGISLPNLKAACATLKGLEHFPQNLPSALWRSHSERQRGTYISYQEGARLNPLGYQWLRMTTRALSLLNSKTTPTYRDFFLELQKMAGEDENTEKFKAAIQHGNEWLNFIENERHPTKPTETPQKPPGVVGTNQNEIVKPETLKQANGGNLMAVTKEKEHAQEPVYDDLPL